MRSFRSHLKNNTQWCNLYMYTHITPRSNICYVSLTSKVIRGHWRSKLRGHWRSKIANSGHTLMSTNNTERCNCLYVDSYDIYKHLKHLRPYNFDPRGHQRSLEVKNFGLRSLFNKKSQGGNFLHVYSYDPWEHNRLCEFDLRDH